VAQEDQPFGAGAAALGGTAAPLGRLVDVSWKPGSPEDWLADLVRAIPRERLGAAGRAAAATGAFAAALGGLDGHSARMTSRLATAGGRWVGFTRACVIGVSMGGVALAAVEARHFGVRSERPSVPGVSHLAGSPSPGPLLAKPADVPSQVELSPLPDDEAVGTPVQAPDGIALASQARPSVGRGRRRGEDPTLVLEAIRALRTDGDPARASTLLTDYLRSEATGVLVEDALALSVEAAVARADGEQTVAFAHQYLARFPSGRYSAFVRQAMRSATP
jgi:hypothetical protein